MMGQLVGGVLGSCCTLALLCAVTRAAEDEIQIRWRAGKIEVARDGQSFTVDESHQLLKGPGTFQLEMSQDAWCELVFSDQSTLELRGATSIALDQVQGGGATIAITRGQGFALHAVRAAFHVNLPGQYSFNANGHFIEGRIDPKGEVILSNFGGGDLVVYYQGKPIDKLPSGFRGFLPPDGGKIRPARAAAEPGKSIAAPNQPGFASMDTHREWVFRELILPAEVEAGIRGTCLELVGSAKLGSRKVVVRYGGIYLLMGGGGVAVISRHGRLVGLSGRALVLHSRTDWSRVFGTSLPASPGTGGALGGGVFGRNDTVQDPPDTSPRGGGGG